MATGLALSTILPGCAARRIDLPIEKPIAVAVKVADKPPAELLRCADRVHGLPADATAWAIIPKETRSAMIDFARAHRGNADQLDRLINWIQPGTCPVPAP